MFAIADGVANRHFQLVFTSTYLIIIYTIDQKISSKGIIWKSKAALCEDTKQWASHLNMSESCCSDVAHLGTGASTGDPPWGYRAKGGDIYRDDGIGGAGQVSRL